MRTAWRHLRQDRAALISAVVLGAIVLVALLAPLINSLLGLDPNRGDQINGLDPNGLPLGPSSAHLLGTDALGRDLLARIIAGAPVSLGISLLASALAVFVGVVLGLLAGYLGGLVDMIIARILDVILALPVVMAAVAIVAVFGPSLTAIVLVLGFFGCATMARIIRGQVISLRERDFIVAARLLGAGTVRVMFVELLPNLLMPIIVYFALLVPSNILAEATLSYLGLGLPAPQADWGAMITSADTATDLRAWWLIVFPSTMLVITTLAFNLLGDGVRDALDPRFQRWQRR